MQELLCNKFCKSGTNGISRIELGNASIAIFAGRYELSQAQESAAWTEDRDADVQDDVWLDIFCQAAIVPW